MGHALLSLIFLVQLVVGVSFVTLDPVIVDVKPVNNARFSKKMSNLFGTNVIGLYKLAPLSGGHMQDVIVENINDTKPMNMLFCERTHENAFMALHIKTSIGQRLVCMEKYAQLPITLYCLPYFLRHVTCNNLYIKRHTVPFDATKSMATATTVALETPLTTPMDGLKLASSNFNLLKLPPEVWYLITATLIFGCFVLALCCCIIVLIVAAVAIKNKIFTKSALPVVYTSLKRQSSKNTLPSLDDPNPSQAITNSYVEGDAPN